MDLGIDLTAATLSEYALSQGIQKSYTDMTQAEKVMLRYNYLMQVTTTQSGDFQRTSESMANSMRTLRAYLSAVGTQIGIGLVAAIRPAIVALNKLMSYLVKASQAFATFMQTIFGKYKGGASGIAMDMSGAEEDTSGLADAAEGASDGLDDAADSAKQLRKELSVLPFDELNQLNKDREETASGKGSGGAGAGGLGGLADGLLDWGDLLNNSEAGKLPDAISEWAKRIKDAFDKGDWNRLGRELAWGINKGIDAVYDALDPARFKKKVQPFITAFTETFNSLVDHIHWNKLGRTVARGINDITWALNEIIEGIAWENLGRKLAEFANGIVSEIDAIQLGNLIGNKFMIAWNMLYGFADDFNWAGLGIKLGQLLNGVNDKIDWERVAEALTTSFNGAFETLKNFTETVHWDEIADNITGGLNKAIHSFKWKENGEALGEFINDLLDTINSIVNDTDWFSFGQGLADMLSELPWMRILTTFGNVVVKAIGGTLAGLATTPSGMFATAFVAALVLKKTAIGNSIASNFLVPAFVKAFNSSATLQGLASGAASLGSFFVNNLALPFAGISVVVGGTILGLQGLAKAVEKAQGGNGKLTSMGTALEVYFGKIDSVSADAQQELWNMVQEQESAGASSEDMANTVVQKLAEMNVSYTEAEGALRDYAVQNSLTSQDAQTLYDALKNNKDMFTDSKESIQDTESGYKQLRDALYDCAYAAGGDQLGGNYQYLLDVLDKSHERGETSKEALNTVESAMKDLGFETDILTSKLGTDFGNTAVEVQGHANNIDKALTDFATNVSTTVTSKFSEMSQRIQENVETQKGQLDEWQTRVQEFHDAAKTAIGDVSNEWGTLGQDQEAGISTYIGNINSKNGDLTTAYSNMKELNSLGLNDAMVKAILDQVPLASQGMTDVINAAKGNTPEWQEFHSSLSQNLNMQEEINKYIDDLTTEFAKTPEALKPTFVTIGEDFKTEGGKLGGFVVEGLGSGVQENVETAKNALDKLATDSIAAFNTAADIHSPSGVMMESGKNMVVGAQKGVEYNSYLFRDAMRKMQTDVLNTFRDWTKEFEEVAKKIPEYIEKGLKEFKTPFTNAFKEVDTLVSSNKTTFGGYGKTLADEFTSSFKNALTSSGMQTEMYNAGADLAGQFANGMKSAYIATPHLYVSHYDTQYNADGSWYSIPNWQVNWYKKGGLFRGGQGTVVGLAEGGKDEAVLPLENSKAMSRIGNAIANAAGDGLGVNSETITDAIVTAMAMNPQSQEVIVNAVLKMENDEVLARAVERGRQRLDSRYNPVAQY